MWLQVSSSSKSSGGNPPHESFCPPDPPDGKGGSYADKTKKENDPHVLIAMLPWLEAGKGDVKQILFKLGFDTDKYVSNFPHTYKDYDINISKISNTVKRVSFRNIPSYVPDEELLNICTIYGEV